MPASFWIILIAVAIYGLVHSLLASLWIKAQARRWFGPSAERWFRLLYNLLAALMLLPVLALPVLLVDRELYRIPFPWLILTIALQGLAVIALLIGVLQTGAAAFIGLQQLLRPPMEVPVPFVTDGLYRWVRHPLYTAGLVFIWLFPMMSCNLLALNIGLTAYIVIGALFEERKLAREFGAAYRTYQQHTPMLIPFLRLPKPPPGP
jgi:protein-S-isoprenylcysteine O-methyltransferase Ste14